MGLMQWLSGTRKVEAATGGRIPGPDDDFWYGPVGGATAAGVHITPQTAIKSAAVYACVSMIAKMLATISLKMYRVDGKGNEVEAPEHFLDELLRYQPNYTHTAVDFWSTMVWWAVVYGDTYAEIIWTNRKPVAALEPVHPLLVTPEKIARNRYRYKVRDADNGTERTLLANELFKFSGLIAGGVKGMGICDHADEAIALSLAADQYASRVFSNSINSGIILHHPGKLSEEGQRNLVKALMDRLSGPGNAHRPLVLQEGMKAEKGFTQTSEQAQLLDARKWQVLEVCRALGMPPSLVGITDGGKTAVEEEALAFVKYTLVPWAKRIEQSIRRDLIPADADGKIRHLAKFNFNSLLRGTAQTRGDYFSKALGSGGSPAWMAVNEVRRLDGLNPIDDPLFDRPALGTNPQQTPAGVDSEAPADSEAPEGDDSEEARRISQPRQIAPPPDTYEAKCARLIAKEVKVLRKYAERFAGDPRAWKEAMSNFYRSQVSHVMTTVGVGKREARIYCEVREKRFAEAPDVLAAIDDLEQNGVRELLGDEVQA